MSAWVAHIWPNIVKLVEESSPQISVRVPIGGGHILLCEKEFNVPTTLVLPSFPFTSNTTGTDISIFVEKVLPVMQRLYAEGWNVVGPIPPEPGSLLIIQKPPEANWIPLNNQHIWEDTFASPPPSPPFGSDENVTNENRTNETNPRLGDDRCPICMVKWSALNNAPLLMCTDGHCACRDCVVSYIDQRVESDEPPGCVMCRAPLFLRRQDLSLPVENVLVNVRISLN